MKKGILIILVVVFAISIFPQKLKEYETKSLFIFPIQYKSRMSRNIINPRRKNFVKEQMFKMFVKDFQRIDFFEVNKKDSLTDFLSNAEKFIRDNARNIAAKRLDRDEKFKEAKVTLEDLIDTLYNSYAAVPIINKIEKKKNKDDEIYFNIFMEFEIYNVDTKEKVNTLKANNKTSILGNIMSGLGSLQASSEIMKNLTNTEKKEEAKFRSSITGLFEIIRTEMKKIKAFQIKAVPTVISSNKFGFDLGRENGIKIDHRYKSYVYKSDGSMKMTAFGKIRNVEKNYSEAEILIGDIDEGDQIMEDPKLGLNFIFHYGMTRIKYNHRLSPDYIAGLTTPEEITVIDELVPTLGLGLEYDTGPISKIPELYLTLNGRLIAIKDSYNTEYSEGQVKISPDFTTMMADLGILKKIYMGRFSINMGAGLGIFTVTTNDFYIEMSDFTFDDVTVKGTGYGFTGKLGTEFLLTPEISMYGNLLIDLYSNPTKWTIENYSGETISGFDSDILDINSQGISFNAGVSFTF